MGSHREEPPHHQFLSPTRPTLWDARARRSQNTSLATARPWPLPSMASPAQVVNSMAFSQVPKNLTSSLFPLHLTPQRLTTPP